MQPFKLAGADGDSGHGSNLILFQSRKNFQKPVIVDLEISGGHGSIDIASVKRVFKTSHAGVKCAGLVEIGDPDAYARKPEQRQLFRRRNSTQAAPHEQQYIGMVSGLILHSLLALFGAWQPPFF